MEFRSFVICKTNHYKKEMLHNSLPIISFVTELSFGRHVSEEAAKLIKDLMSLEKS